MNSHTLKTLNPHFKELWEGNKTFELRKDDRGFKVGDILFLQEYSEEGGYSHRYLRFFVTHILRHNDFPDGVPKGYVIMSLSLKSKS